MDGQFFKKIRDYFKTQTIRENRTELEDYDIAKAKLIKKIDSDPNIRYRDIAKELTEVYHKVPYTILLNDLQLDQYIDERFGKDAYWEYQKIKPQIERQKKLKTIIK